MSWFGRVEVSEEVSGHPAKINKGSKKKNLKNQLKYILIILSTKLFFLISNKAFPTLIKLSTSFT